MEVVQVDNVAGDIDAGTAEASVGAAACYYFRVLLEVHVNLLHMMAAVVVFDPGKNNEITQH